MKKLILPLSLFFTISANAQLLYVNTDWVINQSIIMANGDADTLTLDFDQDLVADMRITSWSNHTIGSPLTNITVLMPYAVGFGGLEVGNNQTYISDCPSTGFSYQSIVGFLYNSDFSNPYTNLYVKIPFKFKSGSNATHFGLLYVRYVNSVVTIEGYVWEQTPNTPIDCASVIWLTLNENQLNPTDDNFDYYNLLGQQIDNPKGLVLKVFESGYSQKVFINEQ